MDQDKYSYIILIIDIENIILLDFKRTHTNSSIYNHTSRIELQVFFRTI